MDSMELSQEAQQELHHLQEELAKPCVNQQPRVLISPVKQQRAMTEAASPTKSVSVFPVLSALLME
jgi:hypothetical protein